MITHTRLKLSLMAMAVATAYPLYATAAVSAGTAQFTAGDVNLRRPDGRADPLVKGKEIESGQSIVTGANGRAQVRFSDGGLLSLQPNTEFKIANYVDKASPSEDRFLVDLVRGSMRAITGLIGKRNRDNYKVTTTTATIGIRGSGFVAGFDPVTGELLVTTEIDAIEVCNAAGCVGLTAGESARVLSNNQAPVRVGVRAPISTPGPVQEPTVAGNQVNADGSPRILPVTQVFTDLSTAFTYTRTEDTGGEAPSLYTQGPYFTESGDFLHKLSSGRLVEIADSYTGSSIFVDASPTLARGGSLGKPTDADFVGWGSWDAGTVSEDGTYNLASFDYVIGRPAMQEQMPVNMTAEYALAGGTAYSQNLGRGELTGGSLNIDFYNGTGAGSLEMAALFQGTSFLLYNNNIASYGPRFNSQSQEARAVVEDFGGCVRVDVEGFFTGNNAYRAALAYSGYSGQAGYISGSAAFQQTSLTPSVPPTQEVFYDMAITGSYGFSGYPQTTIAPALQPYSVIVNDALQYFQTDNATFDSNNGSIVNPGKAGDIADSDFIGWGTWVNAYKSGSDIGTLHYVVGRPTSEESLTAKTGTFSYAAIGATEVTRSDGGQAGGLILASSTLTANFTNSQVGAVLQTDFTGADPVAVSGMTIGSNASFAGSNASGSIHGFFVGDGATRAGVSYTGNLLGGASYSGAAAFGNPTPYIPVLPN